MRHFSSSPQEPSNQKRSVDRILRKIFKGELIGDFFTAQSGMVEERMDIINRNVSIVLPLRCTNI